MPQALPLVHNHFALFPVHHATAAYRQGSLFKYGETFTEPLNLNLNLNPVPLIPFHTSIYQVFQKLKRKKRKKN
jgi:hypothetical protein